MPARVLGPGTPGNFHNKTNFRKKDKNCDYFREFDFDFSLIVCVQIQAISKIRRFYPKLSVTWTAQNQTTSKLKIYSVDWKSRILLLLRFLREIKFCNFKSSEIVILVILEALNFDFGKNSTFQSFKIPKIARFWAAKKEKMAIFELPKLQNLI